VAWTITDEVGGVRHHVEGFYVYPLAAVFTAVLITSTVQARWLNVLRWAGIVFSIVYGAITITLVR
jgi:hypothetical protein